MIAGAELDRHLRGPGRQDGGAGPRGDGLSGQLSTSCGPATRALWPSSRPWSTAYFRSSMEASTFAAFSYALVMERACTYSISCAWSLFQGLVHPRAEAG